MMFYPFKRIVFDCKRATFLSTRKELSTITLLERIELAYHLLYCDPCKRFVEQSAELRKITSELDELIATKPPYSISPESRIRIEQALNRLES